ncbi:SidJ family T4SS effector polyglutamylation protein [Legionella longbeachae]|uniref:Calmodulin-dependent glutamylase SidJ N-terminal domain-containing protein n=1 Tax=Legionella longbeachae serogroup 1 (strain NSW150) TaxID=661367 RepID=D3HM58_LEGLN|nr:SidJ family T4SS effector polyglutamylation protein [Legionella longbeachae]VEE03970.1 substrate of the Dot/Icm secretion system [Legionella oakridgensis]HBD7397248.1 SidJ family T4SS effector polyglutamylation protein [Legionella pneumophila]ARB93173.1 SidJ [Legionella longbeachae]ARM33763.1 SidJ [Legionella longbeachae]EEZ97077.1 SidJ [Legionella longbeachae D-4968]
MFEFFKKLFSDYFQVPVLQVEESRVAKNEKVDFIDGFEKQEQPVPVKQEQVIVETEKTTKQEQYLRREILEKPVPPKPHKNLFKSPDNTVRKFRFASLGEIDTHDKFLLPATKFISGRSIPLKEIPFETTRNELIQIYLLSLNKCIKENKLREIPPQVLAGHYLLIKSLAAVAQGPTEKSQLLVLEKSFGNYLKSKELSIWSIVNDYTRDSEFPIVQWLKNQSSNTNFLVSFIIDNNKGTLTRNQNAFIQQFKDSPAFLFPNPIYMSWVAHGYEKDSNINPMYNISKKTHYYHATITDNLLMRTQPKQVTFAPKHYYENGKGIVDTDFRYTMHQNNLLRIQGRTLLFSDESGELIAVKVQKKGEPKNNLTEEFQMADYLQKHQNRLDLQSQLPTPLGQYSVKRTEILEKCIESPYYKQFLDLIGETADLEVYVYKAPATYFTYLHDEHQSFRDFTASVKRNVNDLFVLLREGIVFSQLADIFHTHSEEEGRLDKGRYQALVQLLSVFQSQLGRLDKWQKAVEFVNLRASGIADLGDSLPITSLLTSSEFTRKYFSELLTGGYHQTFFDSSNGTASSLYTGKRKLFGNYLYLNTIAEYLLVIQLVLGAYGDKVTRKIEDLYTKQYMWRQLTELMFDSCAEAVTLMTGIPHSRARALLNQRAKIDNHLQQTQFWMTPDYADLGESEMRMQQYVLYPGEAGYEINGEIIPGIGLSVDGVNQDLGGYNQELPLRELEKLLYATVTLIEGTMQLDNEFFKQIEQTEKLIASGCSAEDSYQAAAKLLDMARPGCHFQKRLALSYYDEIKLKYPSSSQTDIDKRFEKVEKHFAVQTIQSFWRNYLAHKKSVTEEPASSKDESMVQKRPLRLC